VPQLPRSESITASHKVVVCWLALRNPQHRHSLHRSQWYSESQWFRNGKNRPATALQELSQILIVVKLFQDWYQVAHNCDPDVVVPGSILCPHHFSPGLKRDRNCSEPVTRIYQTTRRDIRKYRTLQTRQSVQRLLSCIFCCLRRQPCIERHTLHFLTEIQTSSLHQRSILIYSFMTV